MFAGIVPVICSNRIHWLTFKKDCFKLTNLTRYHCIMRPKGTEVIWKQNLIQREEKYHYRLPPSSVPLSLYLQEPHQTQRDRKETPGGTPQRWQHTHRDGDLTLSSTTGVLLLDKSAWKRLDSQERLHGKSSRQLFLTHSTSARTPGLISWYRLFRGERARRRERGRMRRRKKKLRFRQPIKLFYVT